MAGAISRACVPPNMPPLGGGDKLVKFRRLYRDSLKVGDWFITLPKTNMDTQNDGLEKVIPFKIAIFGIHVRFLGYTIIYYFSDFTACPKRHLKLFEQNFCVKFHCNL